MYYFAVELIRLFENQSKHECEAKVMRESRSKSYKLVYVGGCPRSGTTMVKRMLDAHPKIYCGPEFGHLPRIAENYRIMLKGIKSGRISAYANESSLIESFRGFIFTFFDHLAEKYSVDVIAEKTPDNALEFIALHELFPEAKLINVIRNPLDVVASYLRCGQRMGEVKREPDSPFFSAQSAAIAWKKRIHYVRRTIEKFEQKTFQDSYIEVKYEDAVSDPQRFCQSICDHIGIEYSASMLDTKRPLKGDASSFGNIFYTQDEYQSDITSQRMGVWHDALSADQVLSVLDVAEIDMIAYGYLTKKDALELRSNAHKRNA